MDPNKEIIRLRFQLNDANARAEAALARIHNGNGELREITELKKKLDVREALLLDIYSSASWKLLRPVRMITKAVAATRQGSGRLLRALPWSGASSLKGKCPEKRSVSWSTNKEQTSENALGTSAGAPDVNQAQGKYTIAAETNQRRSEFERLRQQSELVGPAMLFITLGRGGGTERHVQEMRSALEAQGTPVFILRSRPSEHGLLHFDVSDAPNPPNLSSIHVPDDLNLLVSAIKSLGIRHIHVQHLADAGSGAERMIQTAARICGIGYDVTIHDYMFICPRFTLIGESGVYCGEPEDRSCNVCFRLYSPERHSTIAEWRARYGDFLAAARTVFVANGDVASRMRNYFPQVRFTLRPHVTKISTRATALIAERGERRIAVIGAIRRHKGAQLVLECAKYAAAQQANIRFIIIGYTSHDDELRMLPNVTITGAYDDKDIQKLIREYEPDVAWFPSVCPETFSYTLSIAAEARLFPIAFDFGACAERIRTLGWGAVMPLEYMFSTPKILEMLATIQPTTAPKNLETLMNVSYGSILSDYYNIELNRKSSDEGPGASRPSAN
jgi:glycosyltransferase involved in cell wall biosynthesis